MKKARVVTFLLLVLVIASDGQDDDPDDINIMEERCKYFGQDDSYNNYVYGTDELKYCIQATLNLEEMRDEMKKAKLTGDLDEVFMSHCQEKTRILSCVETWFADKLPCLSPEERPNIGFMSNMTAAIFDFVCAHRGERIAYFLAEGGPECMNRTEIRKEMGKCNRFIDPFYKTNKNISIEANSTYYQYPYLRLNTTDCEKLEDFRSCVVAVLEKCEDTTPSNFGDSLFKFVYKRTKCKSSAASTVSSSVISVLIAVVVATSLTRSSPYSCTL